jgi:hypothetical protein
MARTVTASLDAPAAPVKAMPGSATPREHRWQPLTSFRIADYGGTDVGPMTLLQSTQIGRFGSRSGD